MVNRVASSKAIKAGTASLPISEGVLSLHFLNNCMPDATVSRLRPNPISDIYTRYSVVCQLLFFGDNCAKTWLTPSLYGAIDMPPQCFKRHINFTIMLLLSSPCCHKEHFVAAIIHQIQFADKTKWVHAYSFTRG